MSSNELQAAIKRLRESLTETIVGQEQLTERLIMAILADGHLLVEGPPGLAKTRAIRSLAKNVEGSFQRIQFTPDLLPGDVTGTDVFRPQTGNFDFQPGPIFHNLVLADEINRAPAKVQAALLEAMAERQVSIGKTTHSLPDLFLVMATQNPLEQEGTYPLPEAQLDRFLMHVLVDYPTPEVEKQILQLIRQELLANNSDSNDTHAESSPSAITQSALFAAREECLNVHMAESIEEYIVQLIEATRRPERFDDSLSGLIDCGASPRATLALDRCARVNAWLDSRDYVTPDDVQAIAHDILRHRLIVSFEAEAQGITANLLIDKLLAVVPFA